MSELDPEDRMRFEQLVDAAFNLARWLLGRREDAEDVAQEALLRACRFIRGFHGGDARAWVLHLCAWPKKQTQFGADFKRKYAAPGCTGCISPAQCSIGKEGQIHQAGQEIFASGRIFPSFLVLSG